MKILLIAAVTTLGLFTQSLSANVLENLVGSWKYRGAAYVDGWKVAKATGTMRVSKLGKNSYSMVTTANGDVFLDSISISGTSNDWMFPNGKTAGYFITDGETTSVSSGTWKVSGNKIVFNEKSFSSGENTSSSSTTYKIKNRKRIDFSGSGDGYTFKGSMTR
jgi:hypothetical protein